MIAAGAIIVLTDCTQQTSLSLFCFSCLFGLFLHFRHLRILAGLSAGERGSRDAQMLNVSTPTDSESTKKTVCKERNTTCFVTFSCWSSRIFNQTDRMINCVCDESTRLDSAYIQHASSITRRRHLTILRILCAP